MRRTNLLALSVALLVGATPTTHAAEVSRQLSQRFAAGSDETPDFRKHVVPLLGKLGCNGRSCHGSFQGQAGFRLSLFGYDFKLDHDNLTTGDDPRVDKSQPEESLFIRKPTEAEPHEGGLRYEPGSWEHKVFLAWVQGGAHSVTDKTPNFVRLDVTPSEMVFSSAGETTQLKAVAVWSDGTREDVTDLCRFQSNNTTVAEVTQAGRVTCGEPGDTHVVTFYDNGVVPVPVIRPVSDQVGAKYPKTVTPTKIDELVVQKLRKLGVVQSDTATDAEFLRRVSLDLTGTLPTAEQVRAFLADSSKDKRSRKIDELLASPAYAAWWTTRLCDFTGNNDDQLNNVTPVRSQASQNWYDWIHKRVAENAPYDRLVEGIVLANSREPDESYRDYCKSLTDIYYGDEGAQFADRSGMPHYWARRNFRTADERAIGFAYTFLGLRIQCAQCHKHPFDQWTQDDFKAFTGFFVHTRAGNNPEAAVEYQAMVKELGLGNLRGNDQRKKIAELAQKGKVAPMQEVYTTAPRANSRNAKDKDRNRRGNSSVTEASVLGGETVDLSGTPDPRKPLMDWLRKDDNPYFARAFVNRVWASYFNVGIVEPPDDLSLANPPSNRALLDYLTEGFVASGYDMQWVHRTILNSRTYQLSWQPNDTNRLDEKNFSRAVPRRLPAEVAVDAITLSTNSDTGALAMWQDVAKRSIAIPGAGQRNRNGNYYALTVFGRSIRESNCDCDRSGEASLLQTVFLQNDSDVLSQIDRKGGWLQDVAKELGVSFNPTSNSASRLDPKTADRLRENYDRLVKRAVALKKDGNAKEAAKVQEQAVAVRRTLTRAGLDVKSKTEEKPSGKSQQASPAEVAKVVDDAYLRTLGRFPTDAERKRSTEFVASADDTLGGVRGLLWALLNTKEFIVNH